MQKHKLRKVRPNNAAGSGPWVALACDTCRTAVQDRTREAAEHLHDEIAGNPERLKEAQIQDPQFWLENFRN